MSTVVYLANSFPEASEAYVSDEIRELRTRGVRVIPCAFRRGEGAVAAGPALSREASYVLPVCVSLSLRATWLCFREYGLIADLIARIFGGTESWPRRLRALVHTWLGAYLAAQLASRRVVHIHVHHGFFASWSGLVAARLLDAGFSLTLHGSDLLVRADYLDTKLENCQFCFTVSEFNKRHVLRNYLIESENVSVHRVGVDPNYWLARVEAKTRRAFSILSVGRLHAVKNQAFLLLACHSLKSSGIPFRCVIAGEGPERKRLQRLIRALELGSDVELRGHVTRSDLPALYAEADVVVLTSKSEGLPVTLMEAMSMERIVLAPAITGMPELIIPGKTGLLYELGSMEDFLHKLDRIRMRGKDLEQIGRAARAHIQASFDSRKSLASLTEEFLERTNGMLVSDAGVSRNEYADSLLQQIQLHVQRDRSISV